MKPDRDLLNCATYGDYGDFFAKIEEKKFDINVNVYRAKKEIKIRKTNASS